jgi:exodeoxyribonuclease V beta subunit
MEFLYPLTRDRGSGLLKGVIDLFFEIDGKLFVLDWKSDVLSSYASREVANHVKNHYQLQADIYSLALARIVGLDEGASYERFGGLIYSFVRGLGEDGSGLFFERPTMHELQARARRLAEASS